MNHTLIAGTRPETSFPRKRESSACWAFAVAFCWIPAFAGMTSQKNRNDKDSYLARGALRRFVSGKSKIKSKIKNKSKIKSKTYGYMLLETVVAMALLSVGMVAIQGGLRQAIIVRGQARDATMARHILEQVIGKIELQDRLVESQGTGKGEAELSRFSWTWKISKIELPPPPIPPELPPQAQKELELRSKYVPKIQATVTWQRNGRPFKETAQTLWNPSKLFVPKEQQQ
jgi:hypothetical protein